MQSQPRLPLSDALKNETERLTRSWMQHEASWLRKYLVSGVEDPRLNAQSILSRHFLLRALFGDRFGALMNEEIRFATVMDWLLGVATQAGGPEELYVILHALKRGADNAEGISVPFFVSKAFDRLTSHFSPQLVPNYIENFVNSADVSKNQGTTQQTILDTFQQLWGGALSGATTGSDFHGSRLSILEPACGSANDYRFFQSYGLAPFIEYVGFDLCPKNVENAKSLCSGARFVAGNVFEIAAPDKSFDICLIQDLFEHLSFEGLETAIREVCRVTREGLCIGFFQMDEIADHVLRPVDEYHWNLLSASRIKQSFAHHGFTTQVLHIGTFLREQFGCPYVHNPNAYTLFLRPLT